MLRRGVRHAFANETETPTRVYFVCTPGGLERFFRDLVSGVPADEAAKRAGLEFGEVAPPEGVSASRSARAGLDLRR